MPKPTPAPQELDAVALELFEKLPEMHRGRSFVFTFVNRADHWMRVPETEAEALSGQGLESGASVENILSIVMENQDRENVVHIFGTGAVALELNAIEDNAQVQVVARTIYASVVDDSSQWLPRSGPGDLLYKKVEGFLVEKILEIDPSPSPCQPTS